MDNEISPRPQQTGGLKLMTVFIVVLALHVMVIGGITVYYLLHGENADSDLATDKSKDVKPVLDAANNDGTLPQSEAATNSLSATNAAPLASSVNETTPATAVVAPPPTDAAPDLFAPHSVVMPQEHSALEANLVPPNTPSHSSEATSSDSNFYVVKSGDTLFKIAKLNNLTVIKIKEANQLTSSFLKIGQRLILPGVNAAAASAANVPAVIQAPNTSSSVNGTTSILNDTSATETPSDLVQPVATHPHIYTVVKGDTLTKIAREFKTTPNAIMTENNISDPRKLSIGTKLKIPLPALRTNSATNAVKPSQTQTVTKVSPQLVSFHP